MLQLAGGERSPVRWIVGPRPRSAMNAPRLNDDPSERSSPGDHEPVKPEGLAARAAHWSAEHRKLAIWGWIAFVVVAVMLGNAVTKNEIHGEDLFTGEAHDGASARGREPKAERRGRDHPERVADRRGPGVPGRDLPDDRRALGRRVRDARRVPSLWWRLGLRRRSRRARRLPDHRATTSRHAIGWNPPRARLRPCARSTPSCWSSSSATSARTRRSRTRSPATSARRSCSRCP